MKVATVILANGALPVHPVPVALFAQAARIVCCDGALVKARTLGREPDLVVGDGDSLDTPAKAALGARFVPVPEQETNDLAKAFRVTIERFGAENIVILGADGLREDHFLGNVFRLPGFAEQAPDIALVTNAGVFTVVRGTRTYSCVPGSPVSIFAPEPDTAATSTGLAWPLDGVPLAPLYAATLNRTTGSSFTLAANHPLLVYQPYVR